MILSVAGYLTALGFAAWIVGNIFDMQGVAVIGGVIVFGVGLMKELARHGYEIGPGTLYPTLSKLEKVGFLTCEVRTVNYKQRKYYRVTSAGMSLLNQMKQKIEELHTEVIKEE